MKLNVEDLVVSSFEASSPVVIVSIPTTDDPTPATRCYHCPWG